MSTLSLTNEERICNGEKAISSISNVEEKMNFFSISVQFRSVAQSCSTLCDPMNCSMPGLLIQHKLPEFTQTHVHRGSDAIQPSHLLSSPLLLPPIPPSIRVFSSESTLWMMWPKYWSFSFQRISSGRQS